MGFPILFYIPLLWSHRNGLNLSALFKELLYKNPPTTNISQVLNGHFRDKKYGTILVQIK